MTATVPYRPLGLIRELLEKHGFSVAHCYEDLIFMEHNAFLLRMEEKAEEVSLIFNVQCDTAVREEMSQILPAAGVEFGLNISEKGRYSLTQNEENSSIDITFTE